LLLTFYSSGSASIEETAADEIEEAADKVNPVIILTPLSSKKVGAQYNVLKNKMLTR
jgi:hypothetical protein